MPRIFALVNDLDRAYFGNAGQESHTIGFLDASTRAVFGRGYAAEPEVLIEQLRRDEAIAEADTLLLTVPNQLGVAYKRACNGSDPHGRGSGARLALIVIIKTHRRQSFGLATRISGPHWRERIGEASRRQSGSA